MSVFGNYSQYYDLLYKDKDYAGEARYVHSLIQRYAPNTQMILELGCGTGAHAQHLAVLGLTVHGVDLSLQMLECAQARKNSLPADVAEKLAFFQGDVRDVRLDQTFDGVISLFHVMSYQISNADIKAAFLTAKQHLKPGGIFIFDCWYGPAVLTDFPVVRVKRLEDDDISVIRIAEPVMHPNDNLVEVNYSVFFKDKKTGKVNELKEIHRMRYLFRPEIELVCTEIGFEIIEYLEWMTDKKPGFESWSTYFVIRA